MARFLLAALFFFAASTGAFGASGIPWDGSMVYNVTMNSIEIYNSTTGTWVTLSSTPKTFNIASASAGAEVGKLITGVVPPAGTYTKSRVVVSNRFGLKACYNDGGTTYCTNGSTVPVMTNQFAAVSVGTYATAVTTTTTVDFSLGSLNPNEEAMPDGTLRITYDFTTPVTVGPGSPSQTLNITFDVNLVLQYYPAGEVAANPVIGPGSPSVTFN